MNKALQRKPLRRFIVLSTKFAGAVMYGYNAKGYLIEFHNYTWNITDKQTETILKHLGYVLVIENFFNWVQEYGFKCVEIPVDLSFEHWYRVFDNARDRQDAVKLFGKLNSDKKLRAFWVLEAYHRYLERTGVKPMYAKTFLASKLDDEYDKTK